MARIHGDIDGYYATLRVAPGVSAEHVEKAYQALEAEWRESQSVPRFQIQEAYRHLQDPELKAAYDERSQIEVGEETSQRRLAGLVAVLFSLFLIAGYGFPGCFRPAPQAFDSGDVLFQSLNQLRLGSVVRRDPRHVFPNGHVTDAYLVRGFDRSERWFPAEELERHYLAEAPEPGGNIDAG